MKHSSFAQKFLSIVFLSLLLPLPTLLAVPAHTTVSIHSEKTIVSPGEKFDVGILLKMADGWHTYFKDPGDSGLATSIEWQLPKGFTAGPIRWPKPETFTMAGLTSHGYHSEVMLLVEIKVPEQGYRTGQAADLKAEVHWLECAESCVPGSTQLRQPLKIGKSRDAAPEVLALFEKYRAQLVGDDYQPPKQGPSPAAKEHAITDPLQMPSAAAPEPKLYLMIAFAFLGGLILNLMPCVLPVIAIKILGFVKQSDHHPKEVQTLGWLFTLGVLVSFWALAAAVVTLQKIGTQVGWGFQFQQPWFLMTMALVVLAVALNFLGLFEFDSAPGTGKAGALASQRGRAGAFFNGILATTLATPCTAPFLAPALGFAFTQPPAAVAAIFTAVGLGLALPYLLLSEKPSLLKFLPKPGAWMNYFKQGMGFPMLATVLWLVWNLSSHDSHSAFLFGAWLLGISALVWLVSLLFRGKFILVLVVLLFFGFLAIQNVSQHIARAATAQRQVTSASSLIPWKPYSRAALQQALGTTSPVFIDFTADWCLTCQVNKKTSLEVPSVAAKFEERGIIPLLADWTKPNPEITEALRAFKRGGVPLYVFYPADRSKPAILLPEVLTPEIVLETIEKAK